MSILFTSFQESLFISDILKYEFKQMMFLFVIKLHIWKFKTKFAQEEPKEFPKKKYRWA